MGGLLQGVKGAEVVTVTVPASAVANNAFFLPVTNMANGAYTLVATDPGDGLAHPITITHAIVAVGTDTLGSVALVGTDINGLPISESLVPLAGTVATSVKRYKTLISATQAGWVIAGGNDTIKIGFTAAFEDSQPIDIEGAASILVVTPSTWVTTDLKAQVSADGVTYGALVDAAGADVVVATGADASQGIPLVAAALAARFLRLRSVTTQTALKTLKVVLKN